MSEITELERRITAALDRIRTSADTLGAAAPAGPDPAMQASLDAATARIAELQQALDDEKLVAAQAEERLKSVREKANRHTSAMDIQVFEHQQATAKLDSELQRLRRASEDLRRSNISLREALEAGLAEPHLLNKAMMTELEALRATRSVEIAQADAILASLEPLAKRAAWETEQADAAQTEEAQNA